MKHFFKLFLIIALLSGHANAQKDFKFDFGTGEVQNGFIRIMPETIYSADRGYGLEPGPAVISGSSKTPGNKKALTNSYLTSNSPFYFSVKVPEGNYRVKVWLGDDEGTSDVAIRAECRRMMVNRVQTKKGEHSIVEFTLNIRDSLIRGTNSKVRLKAREHSYLHWDDKLTLEFNGASPKINAVEISPEQSEVITVFLAGNSTVVDGANEPYSAWGQMIPAFFQPGKVAIANYAESGETLSSFIGARRFAKVLSLMKAGDYAFVEFGHNDQKQRGEGVGAFTTYKKNLKFFIDEVKKKGGIPVLVTSVQRRRFDNEGKIVETLGDYPAAVRQTAKEEKVALIDLNAMSKTMYEAWGPEESIKAFAHFPANTYPGQKEAIADNTHFRPFGAYEIAKLILKGIRDADLGLVKFIKKDVGRIDPSKPGSFESFYWPNSRSAVSIKPDGN